MGIATTCQDGVHMIIPVSVSWCSCRGVKVYRFRVCHCAAQRSEMASHEEKQQQDGETCLGAYDCTYQVAA